MRNMVLMGVHIEYIVKRIKKKQRSGKNKEDTGPIKMRYIFKASFYWTFIILSMTIVKGIAIDSTFLELNISKKFSLKMEASLFHYL